MKIITKYLFGASVLLGAASLSLAAAPENVAVKKASVVVFSAAQRDQIDQIIKNYLLSNPEILVEAAEVLKAKQVAARKKMQETIIQSNKVALFSDPNTPAIGAKEPTVYLVEFFDYQCGHCKNIQRPIEALVKANPGLRVLFKEFPIFGQSSEFAAKVALAANLQGKYWPVHEALLASDNPMTEEKALAIAKKAGCDMKKLGQDIGSEKVTKALVTNRLLAESLQLEGTPALIFVNSKQENSVLIPGSMQQVGMQAEINKQKDSNS